MWLNLQALEQQLRTEFTGRRLLYFTSASSTQSLARREAEEDAPAGTVVVAEEQTAGRGRFGRAWVSPAGQNLYLTLLLRPPLEKLRVLSMATPLAVCLAIEDVAGVRGQIKWPNDVLLSGRKAAGILIESELSGHQPRYSLVGIGLNVNSDPSADPEISGIATSVKLALGREVARETVLAAVLNQFERLYKGAASRVYAAWKAHLQTLGQTVTVTLGGETFRGVARDVDSEGNLIVRGEDGTVRTFEAGEVTLRPPER
jgi:BirA family biotin operon repressor/biotin-[acetyl-CoA-carboxylase] ligase